MQEFTYKKIALKINSKDILRMSCGLFLILQALLFVIDDSFYIFKTTSKNFLQIKFIINYIISSIFLLSGLLLIVGLKIKLQIYLSLTLLLTTLFFLYINQDLNLANVVVPCIILILSIRLLMGKKGNASVDKLFK